ncbi:hypothetical protein FA743_03850 [Paracoccus gahaiensis]|uniref:Uncharacterized protein n=1 Tax=Paracoccus gahaiensis TaxID=1706839 RepID=A0A4U0RF99_9RHOB|nr:DUF6478 family protein [Paracoccus gahaiensis]TJZ93362.1 hypothetical protein FA743_03850 [Paracoccus gahaiensis]
MALNDQGWLSGRIRRNAFRQWNRFLRTVSQRQQPVDHDLRDEARDLQQVLARFLQIADARAVRAGNSLSRIDLPAGTDWRWRPQVMSSRSTLPALISPPDGKWLSEEVALYHDCPERALILCQIRNRLATDLAEYGIKLEVMGFSGSYLSFSLALPPEALENLGGHYIIRLDARLQAERPIRVYSRLNIQQGPNTETLLRQMGDPIEGGNCQRVVEFDLGYAELSQRSVDKAWLDVILEAPYMNAVSLRDVILSRHPRAHI